MLKIKEILFKTLMSDGEEYDDRYLFKGKLDDLLNYQFTKLNENDIIEELKIKIKKDDNIYYKKSGCGYFIVYQENNYVIFMSGVPMWWIGDEDSTNYYDDLECLIKAEIVEKSNGFGIKQEEKEKKKEILDKDEKEYLENLLRPFKSRIEYIVKVEFDYCKSFLEVGMGKIYETFCLPTFETNKMYKGMEIGKEYTLKELGLFESKKKQ